ncbi:hypothetical protein LguiA_028746 [Lonicera macranthoides]
MRPKTLYIVSEPRSFLFFPLDKDDDDDFLCPPEICVASSSKALSSSKSLSVVPNVSSKLLDTSFVAISISASNAVCAPSPLARS